MTDTVHILLPVHNRRKLTERFVECLCRQTYRAFHLVLIDDGSTDGTAGMVLHHLPEATILRGQGTWWWAGSLQQGLRSLYRAGVPDDDLVLIVNDDTTIEPEFVERGVEALRGKSRTLLLAQLYDEDTGGLIEYGARVDWRTLTFCSAMSPSEVNCLSTRGLFMRVSDTREIGRFHPTLLPHYMSDYEYTLRALRKGLKLLSVPEVSLSVSRTTTGLRNIDHRSPVQFISTMMSKRAAGNPLYWTTFILLACPARYIPLNLFRVWRGVVAQMFGIRRRSRDGVY